MPSLEPAPPSTETADHRDAAVAPDPWEGLRVRVRFADTDAMGVVYHGNYLRFFEAARVEMLRASGSDYRTFSAGGLHLPVITASVRYIRPAVFDDDLLVQCYPTDVRRARFSFCYRVVRLPDGELLVTGRTQHACVDVADMKPRPLPVPLRAGLLRAAHATDAGTP